MVAGLLQRPDVPVHAGGFQPRGELRAQEQVVDADARVAGEGLPEVVPEGVDLLPGMHGPQRIRPALGEELSVSGWKGVVITEVKRGSYARELGLKPGDIVARVNGAAIDNVEDLKTALAGEHEEWELSIERDGKINTFTVR